MAIANGSRSKISYVVETAWGTTPATPVLHVLPYVSFGVNASKEIYNDDSIQSDRMLRHSVHGNRIVSGPMAVNLSATDFDPLLESVCNGAFATNVLKTGVTQKSFTFEQSSADIDQHSTFMGVVVNKATISVPVNGLVTATFDLIGKSSAIDAVPLLEEVGATEVAASALQPFFHAGGTFKEGGVAIAILTSIELSIDNSGAANYGLGSVDAANLSVGMSNVSGTVNAYFEDASLVNKFLAGTDTSIEFTLTDGIKTLTFKMGKVRYTGATKSISGQGPVILQLPFSALYNAADTSNIVITRN